jgi:hypothetical protein
MPDTGAPWNIPYVAPTDNPRLFPAADEAQALAIAAGLDAAGGLVAVKSVVKTDTQSTSMTGGSNTAITGLTISHAVADEANKVMLFAQISGDQGGAADLVFSAALTAGTTLLNLGAAAGSRTRIAAQNYSDDTNSMSSVVLLAVHTPGSTASVDYGARMIHMSNTTLNMFINRSNSDTDSGNRARGSSVLLLAEVKV